MSDKVLPIDLISLKFSKNEFLKKVPLQLKLRFK